MSTEAIYPLPIFGGNTESSIEIAPEIVVEPKLPAETAFAITDSQLITEARQLTAKIYLKKGFVTADDIDESGAIKVSSDPYIGSSEYYIATNENSEIAATTRKIRFDAAKGEESFPVWLHKSEFYEDKVEHIESVGLDTCVEISALAKLSSKDPSGLSALHLYRSLIQDALRPDENGAPREKIFLMALSPRLHEQLSTYFDGAIKRIGPNLDYPGEEVVPAMFMPVEGMAELIDAANREDNPDAATHAFIADFVLSDGDAEIVRPEIVDALKRNGFDETMAKYLPPMVEEPGVEQATKVDRLKRAVLLGSAAVALVFQQGPTNEAVRSALTFNVFENTENALAAGGALAAITMAIEGGTSTLIAHGLHQEESAIKRIIQKFKRKSTPELDEDGNQIVKERTLGTKAGDLALAVSIGPGIAMTKRHLQEAQPSLKTDIRRGLGYSAVGAGLSGGIGYLVTGGIQHAETVGLETPAEYVAEYGADARTWVGLLGVIYGAKAIKRVSQKLRNNN